MLAEILLLLLANVEGYADIDLPELKSVSNDVNDVVPRAMEIMEDIERVSNRLKDCLPESRDGNTDLRTHTDAVKKSVTRWIDEVIKALEMARQTDPSRKSWPVANERVEGKKISKRTAELSAPKVNKNIVPVNGRNGRPRNDGANSSRGVPDGNLRKTTPQTGTAAKGRISTVPSAKPLPMEKPKERPATSKPIWEPPRRNISINPRIFPANEIAWKRNRNLPPSRLRIVSKETSINDVRTSNQVLNPPNRIAPKSRNSATTSENGGLNKTENFVLPPFPNLLRLEYNVKTENGVKKSEDEDGVSTKNNAPTSVNDDTWSAVNNRTSTSEVCSLDPQLFTSAGDFTKIAGNNRSPGSDIAASVGDTLTSGSDIRTSDNDNGTSVILKSDNDVTASVKYVHMNSDTSTVENQISGNGTPTSDVQELDSGTPTSDVQELDSGTPTGDVRELDSGTLTGNVQTSDNGTPTCDVQTLENGTSAVDVGTLENGTSAVIIQTSEEADEADLTEVEKIKLEKGKRTITDECQQLFFEGECSKTGAREKLKERIDVGLSEIRKNANSHKKWDLVKDIGKYVSDMDIRSKYKLSMVMAYSDRRYYKNKKVKEHLLRTAKNWNDYVANIIYRYSLKVGAFEPFSEVTEHWKKVPADNKRVLFNELYGGVGNESPLLVNDFKVISEESCIFQPRDWTDILSKYSPLVKVLILHPKIQKHKALKKRLPSAAWPDELLSVLFEEEYKKEGFIKVVGFSDLWDKVNGEKVFKGITSRFGEYDKRKAMDELEEIGTVKKALTVLKPVIDENLATELNDLVMYPFCRFIKEDRWRRRFVLVK